MQEHIPAHAATPMRNSAEIAAVLRSISPEQFQMLGASQLAYARPLHGETDVVGYAVHAADGTPMGMVNDLAMAMDLVAEQDMLLLTVH